MTDPLTILPRRALAAFGALLLIALQLASCGGGGVGSGGTGAPLAQTVGFGTVTGLGSVWVDGVRYDDRDAAVVAEAEPGRIENTTLALGQSVELGLADTGVAASIRVEPRLVGRVQSLLGGGAVSLLGHTVRRNADPDAGPVTVLDGGTPAAGDAVAVHGFALDDGTLQATRIERLAAAPTHWRIAGRIGALRDDGGRRLARIGAAEVEVGAAALHGDASLAVGRSAVVFGLLAGGPLQASDVRMLERYSAPDVEASIGGRVAALAGPRFRVAGVDVDAADARITPAGRRPAAGQYVQVSGSWRADGALQASRVRIRSGSDEPAAELAGTLLDVDLAAGSARLRDTRIALGDARLLGCPGGLRDGLYVEIAGVATAGGLRAESIRCRAAPDGATVERRGTVADRRGALFTLLPEDGGAALAVRTGPRTAFAGIEPSALDGARVRVEGYFQGPMLVARVVAAD